MPKNSSQTSRRLRLTNIVLLIVYQKKLLTFVPFIVCILPSGNVMAAVLNIENEPLLSSPNQTVVPMEEGPTEPGEVGSLNGNPLPPNSSDSASGETSNVGNVNHATVVETVHRVVQEVQCIDTYEIK